MSRSFEAPETLLYAMCRKIHKLKWGAFKPQKSFVEYKRFMSVYNCVQGTQVCSESQERLVGK